MCVCVGGGWGGGGGLYTSDKPLICDATVPPCRRPVPPNCVEVAAIMTDLTIAPPNDDYPLIQGPHPP